MQRVSEALAEAAQREPDLAPYYELHRTLLELQEKARDEITAALEMADEEALQARVLQGLPLVSFAQLPIETKRFAGLATAIAQVLTDYDVEMTDRTLPDDAEWVSLAQQRFEAGQAVGEGSGEPEGATLAQISVDLALKPYLRWAAEQVLPYVDQERCRRGYCPVCDGEPDFAYLARESGARGLLCSRCDTQWLHKRLECPFCGNTKRESLAYYPSEDNRYRLYVCDECKRYLKAIDLREMGKTPLLPVERIVTIDMDLAARENGYR